MDTDARLAILGTGNIGRAMALGLTAAGRYRPSDIVLTRRHVDRLADLAERGFPTQSDNLHAVRRAPTVIVAVEPGQVDGLLQEIGPALEPGRHVLISVVSGASIADIRRHIDAGVAVVRAMPNTAIALGRSMTCLSIDGESEEAGRVARSIFDAVGMTVTIDEELMVPATALCACGIAFFLRAVRSASQGGIEIGFHPEHALTMAAQTALGAASLVLEQGRHPEREIDAVTTPRGCTIAGLNEMEHQGFSSAMIKGIVTSSTKAASLYRGES
jgi:pyrroline-5-carboxylate reductase